ncbi:MAG: histidine kinase [Clostridiaceae bacterium]|nr:histidine kinase [Clostridiaceae bacterium]
MCAWIIHLAATAICTKRSQAGLLFAGMLLLSAGASAESLIYLRVIVYPYVLSLTLVGFSLLNAVLLARRYADAFHRAEKLSHDLKESSDKLNCTETAFMNAQMKPHFLFRVLTIITEKCETDPGKASQMILSLAKHLRKPRAYGNISGLETRDRDLDHVRAYTAIGQNRFAGIEGIIDGAGPLPPISLQPLVENAIRHGLRPRRKGGRVVVSLTYDQDQVLFRVEDNGVGMPGDVLTQRTRLPQGSGDFEVYNIHTRLTRLYSQGVSVEKRTGSRHKHQLPGSPERMLICFT